jgi:hypothetical protein
VAELYDYGRGYYDSRNGHKHYSRDNLSIYGYRFYNRLYMVWVERRETMIQKPIIMSTESVNAIQAGIKTVTRRVITNKDIINSWDMDVIDGKETPIAYMQPDTGDSFEPTMPCPYQKGQILWARETWRIGAWKYGYVAIDYKAGNYYRREWIEITNKPLLKRLIKQSREDCVKAGYKLDTDGSYNWKWEVGKSPCRWRSPMYMPRAIARLFLKVTDIRVERLQYITKDQAIAEGIKTFEFDVFEGHASGLPVYLYKLLWNDLNAKRGYPWSSNPWVWVIEFEKLK